MLQLCSLTSKKDVNGSARTVGYIFFLRKHDTTNETAETHDSSSLFCFFFLELLRHHPHQSPHHPHDKETRSEMDAATRLSAADSLDAMLHMVLFAVEVGWAHLF